MKEVTRDEFFGHIYEKDLDVHPHPQIKNGKLTGVSLWKMRRLGQIIGKSYGDGISNKNNRYWLAN